MAILLNEIVTTLAVPLAGNNTQSGLGERKRSGRPGSSRLPNLPVTLTISLLPSKGDAVYWGKTLVVQREDKRGMT